MKRLGIDIGPSSTDLVVLDGPSMCDRFRAPSGDDGTSGVVQVLDSLRRTTSSLTDVRAVIVGTRFLIECLERVEGIARTGVLRFGLPATTAVPPMMGWPDRLAAAVGSEARLCHGGHDIHGNVISRFDATEVVEALDRMVVAGVRSVAISSVFSPLLATEELLAQEIVSARFPHLRTSLSHEVGSLGLIGRENATILNAALVDLAETYFAQVQECLRSAGVTAPVFLSQNDGTVVDVDYATRYPIRTFDSGMTNAMKGASVLAEHPSCIVADVRNDHVMVGLLDDGFPRIAAGSTTVGGVLTNFRTPDVLVRKLASPGHSTVRRPCDVVEDAIVEVADRMRPGLGPLPVVIVGARGEQMPATIDNMKVSGVLLPPNAAFARAIGAASAQAGGEVDRVVPEATGPDDARLTEARQEAIDRAVAAGAEPDTVRVAQIEQAPLKYMLRARRIRVKAVGELSIDAPQDGQQRAGDP